MPVTSSGGSKLLRGWLFLTSLVTLGCSLQGVPQESKCFSVGGDKTIDCLVYLPEGYGDSDTEWPLVLFLHGVGECGEDLEIIKKHGLPRVLEKGKRLPFLVVTPQARSGGWNPDVLLPLLDRIGEDYRVDRDRIYVTGLSMGGFGTWALAAADPGRFAAAVPICGGGDPAWAGQLRDLPLWVFHGARDNTVPIAKSEEMVQALRVVGGNVEFTVYPEAGHDCWTETYDNPRLYEWLLRHHRRQAEP
jgi:predicted peptidase